MFKELFNCFKRKKVIPILNEEKKHEKKYLRKYFKKKYYRYVNKTKDNVYLIDKTSPDAMDLCVICYDDYLENNLSITLICMHKYHLECIMEWMEQKKTCPLCNLPMKKRQKNMVYYKN